MVSLFSHHLPMYVVHSFPVPEALDIGKCLLTGYGELCIGLCAAISYSDMFARPEAAAAGLAGSKQSRKWLLSQSHLGWPCNRPRLYTVLTLRGVVHLRSPGLGLMERLYRVLRLSVKDLLLAPQDY